MATLDNTALSVDDAFAGASTFHGHKVCELGEDGDQVLVDGHPDDETLLKAIDAYAVSEWGNDEGEINLEALAGASRCWVAFRPHREDCAEDVCESCRAGEHETCLGGADDPDVRGCECEGLDHEWRCSCEDYSWWTDILPADRLGSHTSDYHAMTIVRLY